MKKLIMMSLMAMTILSLAACSAEEKKDKETVEKTTIAVDQLSYELEIGTAGTVVDTAANFNVVGDAPLGLATITDQVVTTTSTTFVHSIAKTIEAIEANSKVTVTVGGATATIATAKVTVNNNTAAKANGTDGVARTFTVTITPNATHKFASTVVRSFDIVITSANTDDVAGWSL